ncbi:MAG: cupin domain-containing protein [Actinomycetota bacterium]|nr:cupin domain-containing protein [Actinomycetota bacterium]
MSEVNVFDAELTTDEGDPEGYNASYLRLGQLIGASKLGMTLYGLPPGQSICPYHYEYGNEEWLLVLEGRPTLRHPGGEDELEPGDVVVFPEGPAGAHKLTNGAGERVLLGILSTKVDPSLAIYPDSNKIGAWSGPGGEKTMARLGEDLDYWDGEI